MQSFKSYISEDILTEAKGPTGAQWESIITHQLNKLLKQEDSDPAAVKTSNKFKDSTDPNYHKTGKKIAQNFISKFGENLMTTYGSGGGKKNLSPEWQEWGGTNGTPKTDMYTSEYNISLKKKGGSQLASGGAGESLATFQAALEYLAKAEKGSKNITMIMDKIEQNFTKVMLDQSKTEIAKISKDQKKIDSLDPKDQKEIQKFISTEAFHKELNKELKEVLKFGENKDFMEYYVFEAMSGLKKFANQQAVASVCVTFDPEKGGIEMINVTPDGSSKGLNINSPSISSELKTKASKVKVYSAWKSSKGKPYSTIRMNSYDPTEKDSVSLIDCTLDSIIGEVLQSDEMANKVHRTLNEDLVMLDEIAVLGRVWNKIKGIGGNALKWLKGFVGKVMKKVKAAFEKIKKLGAKMYEGLFNFMGIEISSVKEKVPSDLQGFIYGTAD
jgi:hypothetical protein